MKKIFYVLPILCLCLSILDGGRVLSEQASDSVPPLPLAEGPFFTIQVASFVEKLRASLYRSELVLKGYHAYLHESLSDRGITLYRIGFGKFKIKEEAEEYGKLFQNKEKIPYRIVVITSRETPSAMVGAPTAPEKEKQVSHKGEWPRSLSNIFAYRKSDGTIFITNRLLEVPQEFMDRLEKVIIFPVQFLYFDPEEKFLCCNIDGIEQPVRLIGVNIFPSKIMNSLEAYFNKNLEDMPLRLEYEPKQVDTKNNILLGHLYLKEGKSINLDMIRQGIAPSYLKNISPSQKNEFADAENLAKKEKLGIWIDLR